MDAVKFIEERNRMCSTIVTMCSAINANEQIAIVEKWSAEHPRKTRQSVFLEQWPCAKVDDNGVLCIYPCDVDRPIASSKNCNGTSCSDCRREFWMQEVE